MFEPVLHNLHVASELLKHKNYADALEALGEIDVSSISPDERAYYNLLYAEANICIGNYDIKSELQQALTYYKSTREDRQFAKAKYLFGRVLIKTGDYFEAREVLHEANATYKRCDCLSEQALICNRLAYLCLQLGEIQGAINYLNRSITIYKELGDVKNRSAVFDNFSSIYIALGRFSDALELYRQNPLKLQELSPRNKAHYLIRYAFLRAVKGDADAGLQTISQALPLVAEFPYERALYFEFLGWIYLLAENYQDAKSSLLEGLKVALEIARQGTMVCQIKRRLADAHLGLENENSAHTYAEEALEIARKANERNEVAGCYRVFALIEAGRGNAPKAKEWFREAFNLFSTINAAYEIAHTRYLAARTGLYENGERQALLYLAREYFETEQITPFVTRVATELNSMPIAPVGGEPAGRPPRIVTVNMEMRRLLSLSEHVAPSEMSILLMGATGTGKDLLARYIHHQSGRRGRFVSVNAAAIPDSMVESELFGHRKGAFTNADRDKVGLIEVADGGTLYLNEIADASPELQAKLLDVVESRCVRRLGETRERPVAFRLIAASNHDLEAMIVSGRFRIDLYHRLSEVPLILPPLRDRLEDIGPLLEHFLGMAGVSARRGDRDLTRLVKILCRREWPGNVRQFETEVKRLALLSGGSLTRMATLASRHAPTERDQLRQLLEECSWNRREVARRLGVSDTTIRRRIRKFNLLPI